MYLLALSPNDECFGCHLYLMKQGCIGCLSSYILTVHSWVYVFGVLVKDQSKYFRFCGSFGLRMKLQQLSAALLNEESAVVST